MQESPLVGLKASLNILGSVSPHDLANGFSLRAFRHGLELLGKGLFNFHYFDRSFSGKISVVIAVLNHRVTLKPKPATLPVDHPLFDAFILSCDCKEEEACAHQACAGMALCKAVRGSEAGLMGSAIIQLQKVKKELEEFFGELLSVSLPQTQKKSKTQILPQPKLEALYFCLDFYQGSPIVFWKETTALQAFSNAGLSDFRYESPHINFNDWDKWPFCLRPHATSNNLPLDLHYKFSDGIILTAHELLYHPHARFVPTDWLPTFSKPLEYFLPFVSQNGRGSLAQAEMIRILQSVSIEQTTKIYGVASQNKKIHRMAFELQKVGFINNKALSENNFSALFQYQIDCGKKSRSSKPDEGRAFLKFFLDEKFSENSFLFKNFIIDPKNRSLTFHPHAKKLKVLENNLQTDPNFSEKSFSFPWKSRESYLLKGHAVIDNVISAIKHSPNLDSINLKILPGTIVIPPEQLHPCVSVGKDGSFCFSVRFGQKVLQNPDKRIYQLLHSLNTGLETYLNGEKFYMVSRSNRKKRQNELKLLGHQGLYGLLLFETASFLLDGTDAQGTAYKDFGEFEENIFGKLASFFTKQEITEPSMPSLKQFCNVTIVKFVSKWIKTQTDLAGNKDELGLYLPEGRVVLKGYYRLFLRLLQSLLQVKALKTRGACFLKKRTPALVYEPREFHPLRVVSPEFSDQSYPLSFLGMSSIALLEAFLPLRSHGFEILFEGVSLESLDTSNFRAEFILKETSSDSDTHSIDWFDLHPRFFLNGVEIQTNSVKKMHQTGILEWQGKFYLLKDQNLPSVKYLEKFWKKLAGNSETPSSGDNTSIYRLPKNQTLELLLLRSQGIPITGNKEWTEICRFYDSLSKKRDPLPLPDSVHADLKTYQHQGVTWLHDLYRLKLGGILADDMGLGKTLQSLAFLENLRTRNEMGHVLILVPTSLTYNWLSESSRFTPQIPMQIFNSKEKDQTTHFFSNNSQAGLICTYGLFVEHAEFFRQFAWNIHIYDEAQHLKNIAALRTHTSRSIPARFKLCLTGTPLENHLGEFYSLVDLVVPGCLGSLKDFQKKYVNTLKLDPTETDLLRKKVKPLILRRIKSEILKDLPPKTESVVTLPFENRQKKIYRNIALSWNEKVRQSLTQYGEAKSQIVMLTALLRLRQACSDPASLPNVSYTETPPKILLLVDSLQEIVESGQSALVFTQFLPTFERIKKLLHENQIPHFSMNGSSSHTDRKRVLEDFQNYPSGSVMLMTLKTGGMGLNLIKATYVFHMEPWWNPAVENQATDRTHRIGQMQSVQVYRYLMQDSVEEKIEILKKRKSQRFEALFGQAEKETDLKEGSSRLTREDFDYLLGME